MDGNEKQRGSVMDELGILRATLDNLLGIHSYKHRGGDVQWYSGYDYLDDYMYSCEEYPHQFVIGRKVGIEVRFLVGPSATPSEKEWLELGCKVQRAIAEKLKAEKKTRKADKKAKKAAIRDLKTD